MPVHQPDNEPSDPLPEECRVRANRQFVFDYVQLLREIINDFQDRSAVILTPGGELADLDATTFATAMSCLGEAHQLIDAAINRVLK